MSVLENALRVEAHLNQMIDEGKVKKKMSFFNPEGEPQCILAHAMTPMGVTGKHFYPPGVGYVRPSWTSIFKLQDTREAHIAVCSVGCFFESSGDVVKAAEMIVAVMKEYGEEEPG